MTIFQNGFEGHTDEQVIDTTNSVSSGFAWTAKGNTAGGGELYADTARAAHGTVSCRIDAPAASSQNYFRKTVGSSTSLGTRMYVYLTAAVATAEVALPLMAQGVGSGNSLIMRITATNQLRVLDSAGTIWTAAATFPLNQWVRLEMWGRPNATTAAAGHADCAYFIGDSTTPIETFSTAAANLGTANLTDFRVGKVNAGSYATTFWMDDIYADDAATGLPGPVAVVAATTVRPNAVVSNTGGWTAVGAADIPTALADELNSSWIETTGIGAPVVLGTPPIADGQRYVPVVMSVAEAGQTADVRVRMRKTDNTIIGTGQLFTINSTPATYQYKLSTDEQAAAAVSSSFYLEILANST